MVTLAASLSQLRGVSRRVGLSVRHLGLYVMDSPRATFTASGIGFTLGGTLAGHTVVFAHYRLYWFHGGRWAPVPTDIAAALRTLPDAAPSPAVHLTAVHVRHLRWLDVTAMRVSTGTEEDQLAYALAMCSAVLIGVACTAAFVEVSGQVGTVLGVAVAAGLLAALLHWIHVTLADRLSASLLPDLDVAALFMPVEPAAQ